MQTVRKGALIKWLGVVPGLVAATLSISGLIGAHAVLAYRVEAVETKASAIGVKMTGCADRLARIEGKLDILIGSLGDR